MWYLDLFKPIRRRIRMYFRQRMLPMSADEAEDKREFLSKLYFFCTFSGFSILTYSVLRGGAGVKRDEGIPIGEATVERLKLDGDVRIIRLDGFKKVEDYVYNREKKERVQNEVMNAESIDVNTPVQEF